MHVCIESIVSSALQPFRFRLQTILFITVLTFILFQAHQRDLFNSSRQQRTAAISTIIVVTPTNKRKERIADMLRLSQTLSHIRNLHWIVVEDGITTANPIERLLNRSAIPHVYIATPTAPGMPRRGWTHRNLALQYIRENYSSDLDALLYFADDDNSYDIRLFDKYIRKVKRLGIWPVGLVGRAWVESPKVGRNGKVVNWNVIYAPRREFATDMAGFAIHLRELFRVKNATFSRDCAKTAGLGPESCFLTQFGFKKHDAEPFGYDEYPKDILVWHTKTKKPIGSGPLRGFVIE